jgi:hypothetical protein
MKTENLSKSSPPAILISPWRGSILELSGNLAPYLSSGGARNYGKIPGSQWDELLTAAASAGDENGMRQTQFALQQAFVQELPFIMLYFRIEQRGIQRRKYRM